MGTAILTTGPLKQVLVATLRANSTIKAAAVGGFHEGINNADTIRYPYVVYGLAAGPIEFDWGGLILEAAFDIVVRGPDPVEVNTLDALITAELNDSTLTVTELPTGIESDDVSTLIVRREMELPLQPDRNAEGKTIYQNGAMYSFWVEQRLAGA